MEPTGLLLSGDLLDGSRVTSTARALGLTVKQVRTVEALLEAAGKDAPTCVIIDLHHPGLDVPALLSGLTGEGGRRPRVVGFGAHVDAARLRSAREAGCDVILPRSKFMEDLATALPGWLGS